MPEEKRAAVNAANTKFDVLAIGNPIVDIIAQTEDAFLEQNDITKAAMNLIDAQRAELLYQRMGERTEASGGSAGNTAAAIASLGGRVAYAGKVADDKLGHVFRQDMQQQNVVFTTPPLAQSANIPTARSMIFVTPDGERSMNTYLGACTQFASQDIDQSQIAAATITYFEGYLWDSEPAKEALLQVATLCHQHNRKMAMSLSDSFCVDRFRAEFLELIHQGAIDILFANEAELLALYQTNDFDTAIAKLQQDKLPLAAITRGPKGSVVVKQEEAFAVPAVPVDKILDKTGAGDIYAAGFLYGLTHQLSLHDCANLGSFAAGLVISQIGPRVNTPLADKARKAGFLSA